MKIRIKNKVIGEVKGENFIKKVRGSKHFLRTPPAIAFDIKTLKDAYNLGARNVIVIDVETQIEYISTIGNIYANGFDLDRGYGKQVALPMPGWKIIKPSITVWAEQKGLNI